jgi:hypothetical protein
MHAGAHLHELNDGGGEGEVLGAVHEGVLVEVVGHHEVGQVAHHLAAGGDFHDVAEGAVCGRVGFLNLIPLLCQACTLSMHVKLFGPVQFGLLWELDS